MEYTLLTEVSESDSGHLTTSKNGAYYIGLAIGANRIHESCWYEKQHLQHDYPNRAWTIAR
ncbi:MAG: hypothetical protein OXN17_00855 [Candidatus Poribacteria bacterium]|nr:hypothetical protein [Candidatus Poribacteria bacterium]